MNTQTQVRPANGLARAVRSRQPGMKLTRRGRMVFGLGAALFLSAGMIGGSAALASGESESLSVDAVTVRTGESLWDIASKYAAEGQDVRDVIDDLQKMNGLSDSSLRAGQRLLVPSSR